MPQLDKKSLSEADIRTKFITPAIERAGWDLIAQVSEEVYFTDARVIWKGKTVKRGERKRADYILYYKPNIPIAVVKAKDTRRKNRVDQGVLVRDGDFYRRTHEYEFTSSSAAASTLLTGHLRGGKAWRDPQGRIRGVIQQRDDLDGHDRN